jgi:hypothetical protein
MNGKQTRVEIATSTVIAQTVKKNCNCSMLFWTPNILHPLYVSK